MGFAVIHIEKGTAGKAGGLGSHIDRSKNVPNANPELSVYNARVDLQNSDADTVQWTKEKNEVSLQTRINERIKEGYRGKTAIRKDAVTHLNVVLSGSHLDMLGLVKEKKLREWADDNYKFACERFGEDNIVEFTVHLDERTPHIHCVAVPLTSDGRLSAKEVMGDRKKMNDLQEEYSNSMKKYNLDRGVKGSTATHDSIQEYYARLKSSEDFRYQTSPLPVISLRVIDSPPKFLLNTDGWRDAQMERITGDLREQIEKYNQVVDENEKVLETAAIVAKTKLQEEVVRVRQENAQLKGALRVLDRQLNPEKYERKVEDKKGFDREENISKNRGLKR